MHYYNIKEKQRKRLKEKFEGNVNEICSYCVGNGRVRRIYLKKDKSKSKKSVGLAKIYRWWNKRNRTQEGILSFLSDSDRWIVNIMLHLI